MVRPDPETNVKKQITRRDFLKAGGTVVMSAVLFNVLAGCNSKTTSTTSETTSTPITTSETTSSTSTTISSTAPAPKTLTVGHVEGLSSNVALDLDRTIKLLVEKDNNNGGLKIGGDTYNIKIITYDSQNTQDGEVAAINRLIFEDKVQYIISNAANINAWNSISEQNKVIILTYNPLAMDTAKPNLHYVFNGSAGNPQLDAVLGWFCKNNPDVVNDMAAAFPDNQLGHIFSMVLDGTFKSFGATLKPVFFPANQQDLSSLGTQITTMKPAAFTTMTASDTTDALVLNAVRQSGYKGKFVLGALTPYSTLKQVMAPEALEGITCGAMPTEFTPPLTPQALNIIDLWKAKYGKWEDPQIFYANLYFCLKAGLLQAGSVDTDKVSGVLSSGMKYDTWSGGSVMISRPDLGNDRTVDSISPYYIKTVQSGAVKLVDTVSLDQAISIFRAANPTPPPGAAPPGPPGAPAGGGPPPGGPPPG